LPLRLKGEQVYRLQALPLDDELAPAVQLFTDRARLVRHDFEVTAESLPHIVEICRKLDGVPLAIELAAAWVDAFTLPELAAEMSSQLELAARMQDTAERHQSVRASLDWSWGLLTDEQRSVLRRLAVFRAGFLLDAAASVLAGVPGLNAAGFALRGKLSDLVDRSWLFTRETADGLRYFLRDAAAREYAQQRLAESAEQPDVLLQHARHYATMIAAQGQKMYRAEQAQAMRLFRAELHNVFQSADVLLERGEQYLGPLVEFLYMFFDAAGLNRERVLLYEKFLTVARRSGESNLLCRAALGLAMGYWRMGEFDKGQRLVEEVLEVSRNTGDKVAEAHGLHNLSVLRHASSHFAEALDLNGEAIHAANAAGDAALGVRSLFNRAVLLVANGRDSEVDAVLDSCETQCRTGGFLLTLATVNRVRGTRLRDAGKIEEAVACFEKSLHILEELDSEPEIVILYAQLILAQIDQANYALCRKSIQRMATLADLCGMRGLLAQALEYSGVVSYAQDDMDAAEAEFRQCLNHYQSLNSHRQAFCFNYLSLIALKRGDCGRAAAQALNGLQICRSYALELLSMQLLKTCALVGAYCRPGRESAIALRECATLMELLNYPLDPVEAVEFSAALAGINVSAEVAPGSVSLDSLTDTVTTLLTGLNE
jgi:tetratricopeptide (TPR) repeat protein